VPALGGTDRPRRARVFGAGYQGVVPPLAVAPANRVDRGQVDDVEPHGSDGGQALGRRREIARGPAVGLRVEFRAFGTREEFVPGAASRAVPLHQHRVGAGGGDQAAHRMLLHCCQHRRLGTGLEAFLHRPVRIGHDRGSLPEHLGIGAGTALLAGGPGEQPDAFGQHQLHIHPGGDLHLGVVQPGRVQVRPPFNGKGPVARVGRAQRAGPTVGSRDRGGEPGPLHRLPVGVEQHRGDSDQVVAFPENGGRHFDVLARNRLGRKQPVLDHRGNLGDRDAAEAQRRHGACPGPRGVGLTRGIVALTGSSICGECGHRVDVSDKQPRLRRVAPCPRPVTPAPGQPPAGQRAGKRAGGVPATIYV
jgi:hypothetical protein